MKGLNILPSWSLCSGREDTKEQVKEMVCQRVRSGLQTTSKAGKELGDDGKVVVLLKMVRKSLPDSKGPAEVGI